MRLERKYLGFDGLNLTWETLEGLAKHNGPINDSHGSAVAKVARLLEHWRSLQLEQHASAEAQVAALADDIAYVSHDTDDGLRAGLLEMRDLEWAPFAESIAQRVFQGGGPSETSRGIYELTRAMITIMISDCVAETRQRLRELAPEGPDDIREAGQPVVAFSDQVAGDMGDLKAFLFQRVYRHERVLHIMGDAERVVEELFMRYLSEPALLPAAWQAYLDGLDGRRLARFVADFVAGMTDRLAIAEHRRLFDATPELR